MEKEQLFDEAFKIISVNKNKANSLRQFLLKNNKYDNNKNKIIQYLGEFEYDLKTIYNILRELKISNHNNKDKIKENRKEEKNEIERDINKKNRKENLILKNEFDNFENNFEGINKTYSMTTSQIGYNQNYDNNINDYYINSFPRREYDKRLPRSISCKSYIGNWNSSYKDFEFLLNDVNNLNNNKNDLKYKNNIDNRFTNNILSNNEYINNKYNNQNRVNNNVSKDKTLKLNFDYDSYLTDYSLNRTNKNNLNDSKNNGLNNSKRNLNSLDLNNDNYLNNNLNNNIRDNDNNYNNKINLSFKNNNNINNNSNNKFSNENDNNMKNNIISNNIKNGEIKKNDENNNIFTFSEPKNENKSYKNNYDITFNPNNKQSNKDLNLFDKDNNIINNFNNMDSINNNSKEDEERSKNNINKYNNDLNQYNNINDYRNLNQNMNNKYINNKSNNNNINNLINDDIENDDDNLERQKNEIIKSIVSEIFQDKKKLDYLKYNLGDDIGQKLLKKNISVEELYKVAELLNNYQLYYKDSINHKNIIKKKFNQPSDKILLKESLNNKRYNYREYPRGWNSTKDYFVNNGSTFIKGNRRKK